jgi:hypothetical protein
MPVNGRTSGRLADPAQHSKMQWWKTKDLKTVERRQKTVLFLIWQLLDTSTSIA